MKDKPILACMVVPAVGYSGAALAAYDLGSLSNIMTDFTMMIANFIYVVCIVAGAALILGALVQYREHRRNPVQIPLSRPITMLVTGFVLLGLAVLTKLYWPH